MFAEVAPLQVRSTVFIPPTLCPAALSVIGPGVGVGVGVAVGIGVAVGVGVTVGAGVAVAVPSSALARAR
jgi:UDP-3-O-[3-hydroxymyristoyl] glucosamine N-acyltransferase